MNHEELKPFLQDAGWSFFPPDKFKDSGVNWRASLRTEGLPECLCNERSPQVILTPWRIEHEDITAESVDVMVCGETPSGWVSLKAYNLPLDMEAIEKASNAMKSAWSAAFSR